MSAVSAAPRATIHIVCFEESGPSTHDRVAREWREGDAVLFLGPGPDAERVRAALLAHGVESPTVARVGRFAGGWSLAARRIDRALRELACERAGAVLVAHGPRARALVRWSTASSGKPCESALCLAGLPAALPPAPSWPEGRRERIRRELGLRGGEAAVLVAADPPEWIDPTFLVRATAMASVAGARIRLVLPPQAARLAGAKRFLGGAAGTGAPIVDPRAAEPWVLLPAVDAVFVDRDGAVDAPADCRGWRSRGLRGVDEDPTVGAPVSPLPALWGIACGVRVFAHRSVELGRHADHRHGDAPLVTRFDRDIARLADALVEFAAEVRQASVDRTASAASR